MIRANQIISFLGNWLYRHIAKILYLAKSWPSKITHNFVNNYIFKAKFLIENFFLD